MPNWSSRTRREPVVVPQHLVHAGKLLLNTQRALRFVPETDIRGRAELLDSLARAT